MNTINTPPTAIKAPLISMITVALISMTTVGLFGGAPVMADQTGYNTRTKTVTFADLDLSTVQGQQIAKERVHQMARTLCSQVADPTDMSRAYNYVACINAAQAKAGVSLQALIEKQSTAQLARAQ
jgi:UrcA family protein